MKLMTIENYKMPRRAIYRDTRDVIVHLFHAVGGLVYALIEFPDGHLESVESYLIKMRVPGDNANTVVEVN